jgi:uncharacterized protein YgiM (DUF1202 family)
MDDVMVNSDKSDDSNESASSEKSNELDDLQNYLNVLIKKENAERKYSGDPGITQDNQQQAEPFIKNLQQQMDEFYSVTTVGQDGEEIKINSTDSKDGMDTRPPITSSTNKKHHISNKKHTSAPFASYGKLISGLLMMFALVLWFFWPSAIKTPQEHFLKQQKNILETTPQTIKVEGTIQPITKMTIDPVDDILLAELEVTVEEANLRSKPSINSDIILKLEQREIVSQLDKQGDWFKIKIADGRSAWAHKNIFAIQPIPPTAISTQPESNKIEPAAIAVKDQTSIVEKELTVSVNVANIRSQPSTSGDVLFKLKRGEVVTELKRDGNWVQVRLTDGNIAWAHHSLF